MRILLVEDDVLLGEITKHMLVADGYATDWVQSSEEAEETIRSANYDLVILDVNLPGKSGLEFLSWLRGQETDTAVLMLTGEGTPQQKVKGLDAGADDYVSKPFVPEELLARVRAVLRRRSGRKTPTITLGQLSVDPAAKVVKNGERVLRLSAREYAILAILLENIGRIMSKQQIEEKLYGWDFEIESNTVEVHISNLRKKIGVDFIRTVRGMGYVMERRSEERKSAESRH